MTKLQCASTALNAGRVLLCVNVTNLKDGFFHGVSHSAEKGIAVESNAHGEQVVSMGVTLDAPPER